MKRITLIGIYSLAIFIILITIYTILNPSILVNLDYSEHPDKEKLETLNDYRRTVIQLFGGIIILAGIYLTWRRTTALEKNVLIVEKGQITDRFSKAVEHLGNENSITIRIGGIFALEKISQDSPEYHWTIIEVLSNFVRNYHIENTNVHLTISEDKIKEDLEGKTISTDVQSAITVLGRRNTLSDPPSQIINLRGAFLKGANLFKANLSNANMAAVNLEGANLNQSNLSNSYLNRANLRHSFMIKANLSNAEFIEADLSFANLKGANIQSINLMNANKEGIIMPEDD